MSWKMLYNGNCPPAPPEDLRFVSVSSGYYVNMAIDNTGRLYAWGSSSYQYQGQTPVPVPATSNFTRHPATFRTSTYYEAMVYPYQTGATKSNWVDCQTVEYIHMALDSEGYLYAVGEDAGGGSVFGRGGWAVGSQYNEVGNVFVPGGEQAITFQLVNNQQWTKFVLGHYHVLAQAADKSLWIWGKNLSNATYGTLTFASNYVSLIPILMSWVPGPVKLFDAGYSVTAIVTEGNEVYAWGAWANTAIGTQQVPTLIPFSLPSGTTITDMKCNYSGIVILLSNGDVYGIGEYMGGTQPDEAMVFTKLPGGHHFVKIWAAVETGAAALDSNGVIWAWGNQSYLIVQSGTDEIVTGTPTFTGSSDPNRHRWINFSAGSWSHLAIDSQGRLWSWGTPVYGLLGIGKFEDEADEQYEAIECGQFATLDSGILAYDEVVAGTTGTVSSLVQIRQPLPQLSAHDPCGHWHKGSPGDEAGGSAFTPFEYAANCYEPAISTDGSTALLVLCGRHRKNEFYMVRYNVATGKWDELFVAKDVLCSNWDAGVTNSGGMYAAHVFTYDITGDQYNEETSNPRMITYVVGKPAKEWPGTIETNGRNKVAVTSAGVVACIIRIAASWQIYVSANHGTSYALLGTLPGDPVIDIAVVISPVDNLVYVATINASPDTLSIYTGTSTGTGWALKLTTSIPAVDPSQRMSFRVDGTRFFVATGSKFYYSTNNCTSFTARDLRIPSQHFAATGTEFYNLADDLDYRTNNYEQSPIAWDSVVVNTPIERCCISNAGRFVMFSQSTLRDDSPQDEALVIMMSRNMGVNWQPLSTPIRYFESFGDAQNFGDSPIWPFVPQYTKL